MSEAFYRQKEWSDRVEAERDEARAQVATLTAQLAETEAVLHASTELQAEYKAERNRLTEALQDVHGYVVKAVAYYEEHGGPIAQGEPLIVTERKLARALPVEPEEPFEVG